MEDNRKGRCIKGGFRYRSTNKIHPGTREALASFYRTKVPQSDPCWETGTGGCWLLENGGSWLL